MNKIFPALLLAALWLRADGASAGEHLSNHEEYCQQSAETPCLALLEQALGQTEPQTLQWFRLQSYRLDYLYDKLQYHKLHTEANQLLKITDAPQAFRTQLYFFKVKTSRARGEMAVADYYTELASRNLEAIYQAFSDPMRLLELANLQAVSGQYAEAWQLLLHAEHRFHNSRDAIFLFELNSNKALVRHALNALDDAAYYRKLALDAALPSGRPHDIIVAHGNLARTYQLLGKFGLAVDYYEKSLPYMRTGIDDVQLAIHRLRLAELYLTLQLPEQAHQYLQQVDQTGLGEGHKALYNTLRQQSLRSENKKAVTADRL